MIDNLTVYFPQTFSVFRKFVSLSLDAKYHSLWQDNIKLQKNRKEVEKKNEELKQLREETAGRNLAEIEAQLNTVKSQMKDLDRKIHSWVELIFIFVRDGIPFRRGL